MRFAWVDLYGFACFSYKLLVLLLVGGLGGQKVLEVIPLAVALGEIKSSFDSKRRDCSGYFKMFDKVVKVTPALALVVFGCSLIWIFGFGLNIFLFKMDTGRKFCCVLIVFDGAVRIGTEDMTWFLDRAPVFACGYTLVAPLKVL